MPRSFPSDPRWITVKYRGKCGCCTRPIQPGERAWYWPASHSLDCDNEQCGRKSARDFAASVQDENYFRSQFPVSY
jgi:hypothetical protein